MGSLQRTHCRLCKKSNGDFHPIDPFIGFLRENMSINVTPNDGLSKLLCGFCNMNLQTWNKFTESWLRKQSTPPSIEKVDQVKEKDFNMEPSEVIIIIDSDEEDEENEGQAPSTDALEKIKEDCLVKQKSDDGIERNGILSEEKGTSVKQPTTREDSEETMVGRTSVQNNAVKQQFFERMGLTNISTTIIEREEISAIEISYRQKCEAMIQMYKKLKCSCHSTSFPNLKSLFSHLRTMKIWFPIFTCFHCMTTFNDSSSSRKHINLCPKTNLEGLIQLSEMKSKGRLRSKLYQRFRCTKCSSIFTFLEEFCGHKCEGNSDVYCRIEYYCDICKYASKTIQGFNKHAREIHDDSMESDILQKDESGEKTPNRISPKAKRTDLLKRRNSLSTTTPRTSKFCDENVPNRNLSKISRTTSTGGISSSHKSKENKGTTKRRRNSSFFKELNGYNTDDENQSSLNSSEFSHQEAAHKNAKSFKKDSFEMSTSLEVEVKDNKEILRKRRSSTYGRFIDQAYYHNGKPLTNNSNNAKTNSVTCWKCPKVYSSLGNMVRHFRKHHQADQDKGNFIQDEVALHEVTNKVDNNEIVRKRRSSTNGRFIDQAYDDGKPITNDSNDSKTNSITCWKCPKVYSSLGNMLRHFRKHHQAGQDKENSIQQKVAELEVTNKDDNNEVLRKRRSSTYGRSIELANDNGQPIPNDSNNTKTTPVPCPQCPKVYTRFENMMRHFRAQHQANQHEENSLQTENCKKPASHPVADDNNKILKKRRSSTYGRINAVQLDEKENIGSTHLQESKNALVRGETIKRRQTDPRFHQEKENNEINSSGQETCKEITHIGSKPEKNEAETKTKSPNNSENKKNSSTTCLPSKKVNSCNPYTIRNNNRADRKESKCLKKENHKDGMSNDIETKEQTHNLGKRKSLPSEGKLNGNQDKENIARDNFQDSKKTLNVKQIDNDSGKIGLSKSESSTKFSIPCPQCNKVYTLQKNMVRHLKTHHEKEFSNSFERVTYKEIICIESNPKQNEAVMKRSSLDHSAMKRVRGDNDIKVSPNNPEGKRYTSVTYLSREEVYSCPTNTVKHPRTPPSAVQTESKCTEEENHNHKTSNNIGAEKQKQNSRKRRRLPSESKINDEQTDDDGEPRRKYSKICKNISSSCPVCYKVFSSRGNMLKHWRQHEELQHKKSDSGISDDGEVTIDLTKNFSNHNTELQKDLPTKSIFERNACELNSMVHTKRQHRKEVRLSKSNIEMPQSSETSERQKNKCEFCVKSISSIQSMSFNIALHRSLNDGRPSTSSIQDTSTQTTSINVITECFSCGENHSNDVTMKLHKVEDHGNVRVLLIPLSKLDHETSASKAE